MLLVRYLRSRSFALLVLWLAGTLAAPPIAESPETEEDLEEKNGSTERYDSTYSSAFTSGESHELPAKNESHLASLLSSHIISAEASQTSTKPEHHDGLGSGDHQLDGTTNGGSETNPPRLDSATEISDGTESVLSDTEQDLSGGVVEHRNLDNDNAAQTSSTVLESELSKSTRSPGGDPENENPEHSPGTHAEGNLNFHNCEGNECPVLAPDTESTNVKNTPKSSPTVENDLETTEDESEGDPEPTGNSSPDETENDNLKEPILLSDSSSDELRVGGQPNDLDHEEENLNLQTDGNSEATEAETSPAVASSEPEDLKINSHGSEPDANEVKAAGYVDPNGLPVSGNDEKGSLTTLPRTAVTELEKIHDRDETELYSEGTAGTPPLLMPLYAVKLPEKVKTREKPENDEEIPKDEPGSTGNPHLSSQASTTSSDFDQSMGTQHAKEESLITAGSSDHTGDIDETQQGSRVTSREGDIALSTTGSPQLNTSAAGSENTDGEKLRDKYISGTNGDMVAAVQFLHYHDKESSRQCTKLVNAHWDYATDLTEENKQKQLTQTLEYSQFHKEAWKNATSFAWKSFNDTVLRRWFKSLSILGVAALSEDKLKELNQLKAEMKNVYSTAKVCSFRRNESESGEDGSSRNKKNCTLSLEPDLQRIMTESRDYDELVHVWKAWRDAAGRPIREDYWKFVRLSNEAAKLNGFRDTGEMWRESYESDTFEQDLQELWEQLRPLYENLHAYVRRKLIEHYGSDKIKDNGPIPAHLFGNMWAQSWVSLMDIVQPFHGKPSIDVTSTMKAKNMSALDMFKMSEEFFTSLGLKPMPDKFWQHSLIEKPADREVICHASAWDFCNGEDFRIKQCTDITMEDFITIHHEMGHIQYFLQYAKQPNVFREGANPGFHEAIGDVLALSVSTPKHLQSVGLLNEVADDPEGDLNFLMRAALEKVAFLPSGYLIDLWRWGVFSGDIKKDEMNSKWWELRLKYQGICPPVNRTENDFDPGAKYHVPGNVPYIRYFVSAVIQFQMHKSLCDASGHTGPLHKCDIYRSQQAGQILGQVMELGSSEHWSEVMKIMTGGATNKMDANPILEYFAPLLEFLVAKNANETIGWESDNPLRCP